MELPRRIGVRFTHHTLQLSCFRISTIRVLSYMSNRSIEDISTSSWDSSGEKKHESFSVSDSVRVLTFYGEFFFLSTLFTRIFEHRAFNMVRFHGQLLVDNITVAGKNLK